jgi:hypothetical protein
MHRQRSGIKMPIASPKSTGKKSAGHQRRKEQSMTRFPTWKIPVRIGGRSVLAVGLAFGVAACSDTGEFMFGSRDAAAAGPTPIGAAPLAERDVEAPEVFDVTDAGLWDGRPSLGGVWVAHPDATDPERVHDPQYRDRELRDRGAVPSRTREPRPAVPDLLRRGRCARHPRRRADGVAGHRAAPRGGCTGRSPIAETAVEPILADGGRICTGVRFRNADVPAIAASALAVESAAA